VFKITYLTEEYKYHSYGGETPLKFALGGPVAAKKKAGIIYPGTI
jgi:hypothetical protein